MSYESAASQLGHISLDKKTTGKRSAGKPHAAFDEAGAGNGRYNAPRQFSTLPVRGIEVLHKVEYCGTLDTERQEKQRKQIIPKCRNHIMSTRQTLLLSLLIISLAGSVLADCPVGDLDESCEVDMKDLLIFTQHWLDDISCSEPNCSNLDQTGLVDFLDFAIFADNWGKTGHSIVISEFMAFNDNILADEDGEFTDWIEIYNQWDKTVNLDGWSLTDNANNLEKWRFPDGIQLAPDQFLVLFASGKDRCVAGSELHTNFNLDGGGEYLALVRPDGTIACQYNDYEYDDNEFGFYPQFSNISYGLAMVAMVAEPTMLIPEDANKRVLVPDGSVTNWNAWGLDDSTWNDYVFINDKTGGVGYDDSYEGQSPYKQFITYDVESEMMDQRNSCYIRVPFSITSANLASLTSLTLSVRYDDAFVAYINGNEVARSNFIGDPEWNSTADSGHSDEQAVIFADFDLTSHIDTIQDGNNVLAVQGLNVSSTSSDFLISLELSGIDGDEGVELPKPYLPLYFVTPTPGEDNWAGAEDLGPIIKTVKHTPQVPQDDDDIVVTAEIAETFDPLDTSSVRLHYRLMYNTESLLTMTDDGSGNDTEADDGIYTATISHTIAEPNQMVRWYVTAADTNGVSSRWPLFPDPLASEEYLGTIVTNPALTSDMPILHWYVYNTGAADSDAGTRASLFFNGEFYDNVFVRIRGRSTKVLEKKSHKFDFNKGHYFKYAPDEERVDEINLNAEYGDPSYMRNLLSFRFFADVGMPACHVYPFRLQQNGEFHSMAIFVEQVDSRYLDRNDLDRDGPLYKAGDDSYLTNASYDFRLINGSSHAPLVALVNGLALSGEAKMKYLFDNVSIPEVIDHGAAHTITGEVSGWRQNYYMHMDTNTWLWYILSWDRDFSWGNTWMGTEIIWNQSIYYGDGNRLFGAIYGDIRTKEMFLRRLRTLMDEFMKTTDHNSPIDTLIGNYHTQMKTEADRDRAVWGFTTHYYYSGFPQVYIDDGVAFITDESVFYEGEWMDGFLPHRRDYLYGHGDLPAAQPKNPSPTIDFGTIEYNPSSANQDQEYIQLINNNAIAVDISGWKLKDGVEFTFPGGTVIGKTLNEIYVSPDQIAFKNRTTSPKGQEGHFVVGNYKNHLSSWGETINLFDANDNLVNTITYPPSPSNAQMYLRITEVMYHPADGSGYNEEEFEYIELKNIGSSSLLLDGVRFSNGIYYYFELGANLLLAAGDHILVIKNQAAFALRYDTGSMNIAPGQYVGSLSNAGEKLKLDDDTNSTILEFDYKDGWYDITDGLGFSLTIRDPNNTNLDTWDSKEFWRPSASVGGSPDRGDTGDFPQFGSVKINELLAHSHDAQPDWIELHNTTDTTINIGGWFLSDVDTNFMKYEIAEGTTIDPNGYEVFYENLHFGNPNDPGCISPFALSENGETLYLHSGQDGLLTGYCEDEKFGASVRGVAFGRYRKSIGTYNFVAMSENTPWLPNAYPEVGPIVINEIAYHPDSIGDAEFVEFLNISNSSVTVYDSAESEPWRFVDDAGDIGVEFYFPSSPNEVTLAPGEYLLLVKDKNAVEMVFGIDLDTMAASGLKWFAWGIGNGSLSNSDEKPEIQMPGELDGSVRMYIRVDRVAYDDEAPWPTKPDNSDDYTLHRIAPNLYGNDVINWNADAPTPGE